MSCDDDIDLSSLVDRLTVDPTTWYNSSLISVTQIAPSGLTLLYELAMKMRDIVRKEGGDDRLKHRILASVFYEASTRTSCSFQTAMQRLGGTFIHIDASSSGNTSASKKGESLTDTIKCLQCYTDVTVLRHSIKGKVAGVALDENMKKPIINAGDGIGEHPTQALLDLFTIVDELRLLQIADTGSNTEPLVVVLLGDLKNGRTVHSLAKLLARTQSGFLKRRLVLRYCSPPSLQMPQYVQDYVTSCAECDNSDIIQEEVVAKDGKTMEQAIKDADVLYVTRVQKERFSSLDEYNKIKVRLKDAFAQTIFASKTDS